MFSEDNVMHTDGDKCPGCAHTDKKRGGKLVKRVGKYGYFIGCSRFPLCQYTFKIENKNQKKQGSAYNKLYSAILLDQKINLDREFSPTVSITI